MPFGVDEAGRGPALGSMFVAAVATGEPTALPDSVADSKTLAPDTRRSLARTIEGDDRFRTAVVEVTPEEIDDPETDLNALTVQAHASVIDAVAVAGSQGLCDACDTDPDRFRRRVEERLETSLSLEARHAADETSSLVGAASILAKQAREDHVATLRSTYGAVGSGYPADPTTKSFLESYVGENGKLPPCARRSWRTCKRVLSRAEQADLGAFDG